MIELTTRFYQELLLFAAVGFLIGGLDDCLVDLLWLFHRVKMRFGVGNHQVEPAASGLGGTIAIFVPAWDESAVIGAMLRAAITRYEGMEYRLFVGCYRNDPATIAEVNAISHRRVRLVICDVDGPTTKADCLNWLWRAAQADAQLTGEAFTAIVLHDAEDLVSPDELRLFDHQLTQAGMIQLPVVPIIDPDSRWISGHYCDEFAEAHGKTLIVRQIVGAAIPSAGVGCAIRWTVIAALARQRGDAPFDVDSLTEDYELGLRLHASGSATRFVRARMAKGSAGAELIATRAHFPATLEAAIRQKTRWIIGIALAGWDRLGWAGSWSERWMRLRDRRVLMSALVLAAAYLAALLAFMLLLLDGLASASVGIAGGIAITSLVTGAVSGWLISVNLTLLIWRLTMRAAFVASLYGWREGGRSVPRTLVANIITILAVRRAVIHYARLCKGQALVWDKTSHKFPRVGYGS